MSATTAAGPAGVAAPTSAPGVATGVTLTGLVGIGAGVLVLAAVPGLVRDGEGGTASQVLAGAGALLGAGLLTWAVVSLVRGRVLTPGTVVGASVGPVVLGTAGCTIAQPALLAVLPGARLPGADDAATAGLLLATAMAAVLARRAGSGRTSTSRVRTRRSPAPPLLPLALGAALVGAVVTPGLAASTAGEYAVPHGEHGSGQARQESAEAPGPREAAAVTDWLDPARAGRPVAAVHGH